MGKNKNRKFLIKVQVLKILFYPLIVFFDKAGLIKYLYKYPEKVVRFLGVKKSINAFLQYRDYCSQFKNDFKGTRTAENGTIIFPSFFGANSNFTLFVLLLSKYYLAKGYNPVLVVCNASIPICQKENIIRSRRFNPFFCHECWNGYKKIASETGIDIIYLNDLISVSSGGKIKNVYREIEKLRDFDECRSFVAENIPVGEFALKSALRFYLKGSPDRDAVFLEIYKRFLKSIFITGLAFNELFTAEKNIIRAVIHNGTLGLEATIRYACHQRSVAYMTYETYMGENTLIYKKNNEVMLLDWEKEMRTFYDTNSLPENFGKVVDGFFRELRVGKHKYAVLNKTGSTPYPNPYGKYVCAFTNLNFDTTVIGRNTIFTDMEEWLISLINYWEKNENEIKLVIRVHPAEVKMVTGTREFIGEKLKSRIRTNNILLIDSDEQANAYDLIEGMEYGLIYSSTIGLEIAYSGKACLVAGKPFYRNKPFVLTPDTKEKYFELLDQMNNGKVTFKPDRNCLFRIVYYVYKIRLKELTGIKVFTLNAERNTYYTNSEEMLNSNHEFLEEFDKEFSDAGV
jgi:hypothetical protein